MEVLKMASISAVARIYAKKIANGKLKISDVPAARKKEVQSLIKKSKENASN